MPVNDQSDRVTTTPENFSAFVLDDGSTAGAATLLIDGGPLIARAVKQLRTLTRSVFIGGNRPDLARYAPVVYDLYSAGPLGAIASALEASPQPFVLVLAVNLPLVTAGWLLHLVAKADHDRASAVLSSDGNQLQPLCAVYSKNLLPSLQSQLAAGERRSAEAVIAAAAGHPTILQAEDTSLLRIINMQNDLDAIQNFA
jgi:molybdopterin-guanine dinucleotide biosynthesis protein A